MDVVVHLAPDEGLCQEALIYNTWCLYVTCGGNENRESTSLLFYSNQRCPHKNKRFFVGRETLNAVF